MTLQIAEIKDRCTKATPAPWHMTPGGTVNDDQTLQIVASIELGRVDGCGIGNMEFIAHAREDIPALIAAYEEICDCFQKYAKLEIERNALESQLKFRKELLAKERDKHDESINNLLKALEEGFKKLEAMTAERDELKAKWAQCPQGGDLNACAAMTADILEAETNNNLAKQMIEELERKLNEKVALEQDDS